MTADLNHGDARLIIHTCQKHGLLRNQTAYVLGTAFWETARTMEPVRETLAETPESVEKRLEYAWRNGKLPWVSKPYWRTGFWGRGYVQLTHEANYARAGREIGIDLVSEPHRALEPDVAVEVLVRGMRDGWFTGKKLDDYITLGGSNYRGARRIVNGTDKATVIAELAREYEQALEAEGYGVEKAVPVVNERRDGTKPRTNPAKSTTLQATLIAFLASFGQVFDVAKGVVAQISEQFGVSPEVALFVVTAGALAWVFRERWMKWIGGVR